MSFPDLRIAVRHLLKSPGFTSTAVLMLAIGIGATTAVFSIVEAVLLRPLPFPQSERLVSPSDILQGAELGGNGEAGVTAPEIRTYTRDTQSLESLGGYQGAGFELSGMGERAQVNATRMTAGVFSALGVAPLSGRFFTQQEDDQNQLVAVVSYSLWQKRLHGDPHVLATKILLDREPYVVIGIMPRSFEFPLAPGHFDTSELWVPMSFTPQESGPTGAAAWNFSMVGRLKPGLTAAWLRGALVIGEIATALVLLAAAGLLLRSFDKMRSVDLGYRPDHVLVANYSLPRKQYATQAAVDAFDHELLLRLRQLPGVKYAGFTSFLPATGSNSNSTFVAEGYVAPKGSNMNLATGIQVEGDYLQAMQIPLLAGRYLTSADTTDGRLVIVVNHKLAEHYWPGRSPVGKRLRIGTPETPTPWLTVVGEVADIKETSPDVPTKEEWYQRFEQEEKSIGPLGTPADLSGNGIWVALRTAMDPEQMSNALRSTVRSMDPQLPLSQVQSMETAVSDSEAPRRFQTSLISLFAVAAALLAALGIYSVVAFSAALRVQEMAIRMALGSQRSGILQLVFLSAVTLALGGCTLGLIAAAAASRLARLALVCRQPSGPTGAFVSDGLCDRPGLSCVNTASGTGGLDQSDGRPQGGLATT